MKNRNVGATIGHLLASLREGGGFCAAKDGRRMRHVRFEQASCQRFFDLLFIINEKEKSASLREGGGFCVAKDGRSLRYVRLKQASCQRFFDLLFIIN